MIALRERALGVAALAGTCAIAASSLQTTTHAGEMLAVAGFTLATYVSLDRTVLASDTGILAVRIAPDRWDALFLFAALLVSGPWIVSAGVPAFRQDWYLSPLGSQFGAELWQTLSAWQAAELGSATPQAGFHPLLLVWGVLAFVVGSKGAVLVFVVAALAFAAAMGRRAIAALCDGDGAHAIFGGAFFAFSAPAMNKLVAGHTLHLADQALLALCIVLACRCALAASGRERTIAQLGLACAIALAAPQPQGFVLCALAAAVVAAAARSAAPLLALAIALALQTPTALAAAFAAGETYLVKRAVLEWQFAQSAPPAMLSSLGGYLARYYETGSAPFMRVAAALITAAAALGCARLRGVAAALALSGFVCAFLIMGLNGPLTAQLAFVYQSFSIASLFREIYHLAPLLAFAIALGAAQVLREAQARYGNRAVVAAAAVLACATAPMFLSAARMVPSAGSAASVRALAALPGDGRILWLPGIYPLRASTGRGEGYDPLMRSAGRHAVIYANQPLPMEALAYASLGSAASRALPLLERLGCSFIAIDHDALEVNPIPGALDPARALAGARTFPLVPTNDPHVEIHALAPAAQIVASGVVARTGGLDPNDPQAGDAVMLVDDPSNASALRHSNVADLAWMPFTPGTVAANSAHGAVLGRYVWANSFEFWTMPAADGVVADHATLELPAGVLVANWRTPPTINGVPARGQSDMLLEGPGEVHFAQPAALVGERSGAAILSRRVAARPQGKIEYVRDSPTKFSARVIGGPVHAVVVRERYDGGWGMIGPRAALHFSADGWANGWVAELNEGDRFTIAYTPQRSIAIAEVLAAAGWCALVGILSWKIVQR